MIPFYTLKIYDVDANLRYTITDDVLGFTFHKGVNDDTGFFEVNLPMQKGTSYTYNDIVVGDFIKAWYGWDASHSAGDPDFYGKILQPISQSGKMKTLRGVHVGEILNRRIKGRVVYDGDQASDIAEALAGDLGLGDTEIDADVTPIYLIQDYGTYMDLLRKISDYWYNAVTTTQNDFYVDESLNLVWKARPIRTVGVETLTFGSDIIDYVLSPDGTNIKNALAVYGALTPFNPKDSEINGRKNPQDGDEYTDDAGWSDIDGTTSSSAAAPKIGADCTRSTADASTTCQFYRTFNPFSYDGVEGYSAIEWWCRRNDLPASNTIKLYCPDNANYYYLAYDVPSVNDVWEFRRFSIGPNNTYDADLNPNGEWLTQGTPTWDAISGVEFWVQIMPNTKTYDVDGFCFNFGRWRYAPYTNATSIADYGEYDHVAIDENLKSDSQCEQRARAIAMQHEYPVTRLEIITNGNTNILLGDKLTLTLTPDDLTDDFYVVATEQIYLEPNWRTKTTLLDTVYSRNVPPIRHEDATANALKSLQQISRNLKKIN